MSRPVTPAELALIRAAQRRLLRVVWGTIAAVVAALAVLAALALSGTAAASGPPAISVVGWDPERNASTVWRGLAVLRESRVLPGARRPSLARTYGSVAYMRPIAGGFEIYLTGTSSDTDRRLARVAGPRPTSLAISPDGRHVAFPSARGLETVSALGVRRLVPTPRAWSGSFYDALTFSPDGSLLAFSRVWRDGRTGALRNELAVVGRTGRGARSLAANPRPVLWRYRPTFAPDGRRILFTAVDGSLSAVPAGGSAVTRLTPAPARHGDRTDADPVFSRDGGWIAFTRRASGVAGGGSDVYVVRSSGGEPRRVTTTPLPADPDASRVGSSALAWSPDGTRLLTKRHDHLTVADVATGASVDLARVGFDYVVGTAYWNR